MKPLCLLAAILFPLICSAQKTAVENAPKQVAVFLSCDCPISQKYIASLNAIYAEYGNKPGLEWHFIVPGKISKKELREFVKEYDVRFPIQADGEKQKITRSFNATVTPQVVIRENEILYSGAIDNWFYSLGQYRQVTTEHYLTDALDQVLRGEVPVVRITEAVGCPIAKLSR
jgi:hypothetical protein